MSRRKKHTPDQQLGFDGFIGRHGPRVFRQYMLPYIQGVARELRPDLQIHRHANHYLQEEEIIAELHFGRADRVPVKGWGVRVDLGARPENFQGHVAAEIDRIRDEAEQECRIFRRHLIRVVEDNLHLFMPDHIGPYRDRIGVWDHCDRPINMHNRAVEVERTVWSMAMDAKREQQNAPPDVRPYETPEGRANDAGSSLNSVLTDVHNSIEHAFAIPMSMMQGNRTDYRRQVFGEIREYMRNPPMIVHEGNIPRDQINFVRGGIMYIDEAAGCDFGGIHLTNATTVRGRQPPDLSKPKKTKKYKAVAHLPKLIEMPMFKAHLIGDSLRHWEESDIMGHCLWRIYNTRVRDGSHIAYHLDTPWNKHGLTLVLERVATQRKVEKDWTIKDVEFGWQVHQLVGQKNSKPKNELLVEPFVDYVISEVTNACREKEAKEQTDKQKAQVKIRNEAGIVNMKGIT